MKHWICRTTTGLCIQMALCWHKWWMNICLENLSSSDVSIPCFLLLFFFSSLHSVSLHTKQNVLVSDFTCCVNPLSRREGPTERTIAMATMTSWLGGLIHSRLTDKNHQPSELKSVWEWIQGDSVPVMLSLIILTKIQSFQIYHDFN